MAELPQELINEIFLWLPVKSLLRFRCLSKLLCAAIDAPDFINSHLGKSSQTFNLRKLIFTNASWKKFLICDANVDFKREILLLGEPVSCLWKDVNGYCNGLFLLRRNNSLLSIWNPSTSQFRDLPDAHFKCITALGLGYDDSNNDYKAVCIVRRDQRKLLRDESEVQVWIYGLKSNSWRRALDFPYLDYKMDVDVDNCGHRQPGIGRFVDARLHWLFSKGSKPEIVAFDVIKETFYIVPQPFCSVKPVKGVETTLHVLEGCLFVGYFMGYPEVLAYLYMRKKVGVDEFSWTELFSLSEPILGWPTDDTFWLENMKVLGYSESENKILLYLHSNGMVWYDVQRKSFAKVQIDKRVSKWKRPILCLESLASVGGDGA